MNFTGNTMKVMINKNLQRPKLDFSFAKLLNTSMNIDRSAQSVSLNVKYILR